MKNTIHTALIALFMLVMGLLIGYRATILEMSIHIDENDPNIATVTVWGQSDWYTID